MQPHDDHGIPLQAGDYLPEYFCCGIVGQHKKSGWCVIANMIQKGIKMIALLIAGRLELLIGDNTDGCVAARQHVPDRDQPLLVIQHSEEQGGGKECGMKWRLRWWPN